MNVPFSNSDKKFLKSVGISAEPTFDDAQPALADMRPFAAFMKKSQLETKSGFTPPDDAIKKINEVIRDSNHPGKLPPIGEGGRRRRAGGTVWRD